ncbi:MAG: 1,2-phenylacetyl-CoA epoxidase subunit PaaD [Halobacteriales archaeon]
MASTDRPDTLCPYTTYREGEVPSGVPRTGAYADGPEATVWAALYAVEDPEMPVSIVDLGLIYGVDVDDGEVRIDMTLTYSGCPARDLLLAEIEHRVGAVDGVDAVDVNLVWYPPWSVANVTDAGRDALEAFGLSLEP